MAPFCTIADLEAFLQQSIPAAKIASANRAIDEATASIQNYCNQVLETVAGDAIVLDCEGGRKIFLPQLPVTAVTSVYEDGDLLAAGADEDYQLGQYGILHRVGRDWATGIQIIQVTYDHGYSTIPQDIVDVCTRMAARAYQAGLKAEALAGVAGVTAMSLGDYSVSFGAEGGAGLLGASAAPVWPLPSEAAILNRYRVER